LDYYEQSDILFDQVGSHWLGGVGMYAAYMGKPLIANARLDVFGDVWGDDVPILDASSVDDIFRHLVNCQNYEYRKQVGEASHLFMKEKLDGKRVCEKYKSEILELYAKKIK
jgi:hypothetical protein